MSNLSHRLANGFLKKYHGVQGGVLFRGSAARRLAEKYPAVQSMNNALWAAPAWKWGLAIVPLYGVITGSPVEKVDLNNALGQSTREEDRGTPPGGEWAGDHQRDSRDHQHLSFC